MTLMRSQPMNDDKVKRPTETEANDHAMSRRGVVGGLAAGLVAVPAVLAEGQAEAANVPSNAAQNAMQDPTKLYPQPPFPSQTQPPPGLQSRMNPRPDCGEKTYRGSGRLAGRKALITGGDSGIGRAAAIAMAREGADVAINYLPFEEPDAREVVQLIQGAGRKAAPLPGDIRDSAVCRKLVGDAVAALGGLDIVVNVAGRQQAHAAIADLSDEDFDATFKTNVYAMFWIIKAAIPHLRPGSTIINTASVEAYSPDAHLLDYAPTKAAIVAFTKGLAKQVAKQGIRVNAVAPGPFWTVLQVTGGQPPEAIPQFGANTPYGRPGQPVELAPLYVMLASAESSYASGQVLGESAGRGVP
jgi:NAD(P)-dependent dehydrogenase (short-subunit alcohol dehydrogenase family)